MGRFLVTSVDVCHVNGVQLNYLDWGGSGPPLVLVHGMTDSPHIFDDLAPSLRDSFHVIAYARRGHGASDAPTGPYDQATLLADLEQFLDRLGVTRASLLGWSMGGNEITAFAAAHPERVAGLVYLEAGYDWSDVRFQKEFPALAADDTALRSLDAYRAWYRRTWFGDTAWTPGALGKAITWGVRQILERSSQPCTESRRPRHTTSSSPAR